MTKIQPKIIGTVQLEEIGNISTAIPWEPTTVLKAPFSVITQPNGFLFTHGSACGSLPTTSLEGYTYVSDTFVFRKDSSVIDVDRYIGSITPNNKLAILKIPSQQIPFHHLKPVDQIINNLPIEQKDQIINILGTQ